GQEMPARFGHGSSADDCSRVFHRRKHEVPSPYARDDLANHKWSTGNCSLAYDDARVGRVRPKENRRQGAGATTSELAPSGGRGYEYGRTTEPGFFARGGKRRDCGGAHDGIRRPTPC